MLHCSIFTCVVLDKKLFARAVKDKRKRTQDKDALGALEMEYEEVC
jgi:DNA-directed RNA polymerase subunit beta